jgi:phosphatidylinositol alpha-1,6-mannosyltransferase
LKLLALVSDAYGGAGGIAQYNRDLLRALDAAPAVAGIDVLPRHAKGPLGALPGKVRQLKAPAGRTAYVPTALGLARSLRPDVVFCGHINLAPLAAMAARLAGAKLVMQLHGIEAWERPSALHRRAVERADLVLCVSRYTRRRLLDWADIAAERVAVLPNTVSEAFTPGDRAAARTALGLDGKLALLSVGRLDSRERYKGQDRIIALLPQLRAEVGDVVYLIAGDGDDTPRLRALAAQLGVEDAVRFLGQASAQTLPDLYRAADLFVLPSTGEGFGIVYLEAMACGTPALGLAAKGAVDALADGEAVSEGDLLQAIAGKLRRPRPDPQALAGDVGGRFGASKFGGQVEGLFARLASPPPRG